MRIIKKVNWKRLERKWSRPATVYCPGICLKELSRVMKCLIQNVRWSSWKFEPGTSRFKSRPRLLLLGCRLHPRAFRKKWLTFI